MDKGGIINTILFSVIGTSPAVLTETVWRLVHEKEPIIPDIIVVLTTKAGQSAIKNQLFDSGIWGNLLDTLSQEGLDIKEKLKFGLSSKHIRLFPALSGMNDLDDIITSADADSVADYILQSLRSFTEVSTTQIIASVAGGRKTMGVLLANCMVLVGRQQDRICHVLVDPPL